MCVSVCVCVGVCLSACVRVLTHCRAALRSFSVPSTLLAASEE